MANKSLLTYGSKLFSVESVYFSPVVTIPPEYKIISSLYFFLSKVQPWDNDNDPEAPRQDQKYLKQVAKNIFIVKHITSGDISPVIKRIDWSTGTIYDYYRDDVDMFEVDANGFPVKSYYVRNRYDQIFKCLWNNNGSQSTVEPYFEPGSYGTNNIFTGSDDYKWKYIYTIDTALKNRFMDNTWIPVPATKGTVNPLLSPAGYGNIDVINVTNGGSGYDPANAIITVAVTGDGAGATGTAYSSNGSITKIEVNTTGSNYTFANVAINSSRGSGAVAIAPVSPIGGHGYEVESELGCNHVMVTSQFNGSESGLLPTDMSFHQVGILNSPVTLSSPNSIANGAIYKTTTDLIVSAGFGVYQSNEYIYQGNSINDYNFIGRILSFDPASNVVKLINTRGTLIINSPVFGDSSKTTRTLLSYNTPEFVTLSGNIFYLENRAAVQRSSDGIEQFKVVLKY